MWLRVERRPKHSAGISTVHSTYQEQRREMGVLIVRLRWLEGLSLFWLFLLPSEVASESISDE